MWDNLGNQNLPTEPLESGSSVKTMNQEQIKNFHLTPNHKLQIRYLLNLNSFGNKLNPGLFGCITKQLKTLLNPSQFQILELIERDLLWQNLCPNKG